MSDGHVPEAVREQVRQQAGNRCGYCRSPQHLVYCPLEIEHIIPTARGGSDEEENLWLACRLCNGFKATQIEQIDPESGEQVTLFDPRRQVWQDHFGWSDEGTRILGQTGCGRVTVLALQLNNPLAVLVRQSWVQAGWHPPSD